MLKQYSTMADVFWDSKYLVGLGLAKRFGLSRVFDSLNTIEDIANNTAAVSEIATNFKVLYAIFKSQSATSKFYASDIVIDKLLSDETFRTQTFNNEQVSGIIEQNEAAVKKLLCTPCSLNPDSYTSVQDLVDNDAAMNTMKSNALSIFFLSKMPTVLSKALRTDQTLNHLAGHAVSREAISNSRRAMNTIEMTDVLTLRWILSGTPYDYTTYATIAIFRDANTNADLMGLAANATGKYRAIRSRRFMYSISAVLAASLRFLCAQAGLAEPAALTAEGLAAETEKIDVLVSPSKLEDTVRVMKYYTHTTGGSYQHCNAKNEFWLRLMCAVLGLSHADYENWDALRQNQAAAQKFMTTPDALELQASAHYNQVYGITMPVSYPAEYAYVPRVTPQIPSGFREYNGYLFTGNTLEEGGTTPANAALMSGMFSETNTCSTNITTTIQNAAMNAGHIKPNWIVGFPAEKLIKPSIIILSNYAAAGYYLAYVTDRTIWGSVDGESWFQLCDSKHGNGTYHNNASYIDYERLDCPVPIRYIKYEWKYYGQHHYYYGVFIHGDVE